MLGVVITSALFHNHPDLPEGQLAKLRAAVVNMRALADVARGKVLSIPAVRYKAVYTALRHLPRPAVRWISRQVSGARKREKAA